jgi:hypothetical protein
MGVVRTTYLIDEKGVVRRRWDRVKVTGHALEVLGAVQELKGMAPAGKKKVGRARTGGAKLRAVARARGGTPKKGPGTRIKGRGASAKKVRGKGAG